MDNHSTTKTIHTFHEGDMFDGRYRLVKRAGSGGFADVWRAEDTLRKNKIVALKIYTRLDDEGIREMSEEYDATEYLRHPNLLTGNHFAAVDNTPYMEMQFCDGGNMAHKAGRLTDDELRHVMRDVLSGLVYLHSQGIVHQDIKPENILYDTGRDIYLLADFGISGKSRSSLSKSVRRDDNSLSMTLAYAPPEKFSSNPADWEPSTKGDIFSLGVTLFELDTGNLPFAQPVNTGDRMLEKEGNVKIYFDSIDDPTLRHMAERCIRYRREERPTAEELLAMLDSKTESQPESKPEPKPKPKPQSEGGHGKTVKLNDRPVTTEPKPAPKPHKNNWWIYAVMAAVAIALGILIPKACMKQEPAATDSIDTVAAQTPPCPPQGETSEGRTQGGTDAGRSQEGTNAGGSTNASGLRIEGNDIVWGKYQIVGNDNVYYEYRYKMVYVSGGTYMMGAADGDSEAYDFEKPAHSVTVGGFRIGQTEVPRWLWEAVMGSVPFTGYDDDHPQTGVTWNDCQEFIAKLNSLTGLDFRLPTEEEWEFAARGGNHSRGYKYSGSNDPEAVAWYRGCKNQWALISRVGGKQANELGLHDMSGNAKEWCSNCWSDNYNSRVDCTRRVVRGGATMHADTIMSRSSCRVTWRNGCEPSVDCMAGFRLAR